jgi:hypothetical protein
MRTCSVSKGLLAPLCVFSLAAAFTLLGCGSDLGSPPTDAAKDVPAAVDSANSNPSLDAAGAEVLPSDAAPIDAAAVPMDVAPIDVAAAVNSGSAPDSAGSDTSNLPACSSLVNPLYIMAGDCQIPALKTLGKILRQSANPVTLVWRMTPSCTIIDAFYNGTPLKQIPSYIPDDPAWDPVTSTVPSCALESAGHGVDLGMPIGFPESCSSAVPPSDVVAFKGPVQSLLYVVPHSATPEAISSGQARLVFGTGSTANISPWIDENFYFILQPAMMVQVSLGALIGVPAAQWHGQQQNGPSVVANAVATSTFPEKTIGIVGGTIFDSGSNRAILKALAFQATGQANGYLPDSTATAFDKRSLRDGHYVPWNQMVYLTKASSADGGPIQPINATAKLVIDILTNAANPGMPAGLDPVALVAQGGLVPLCAMAVTRTTEGGSLSLLAPPDPCGCYFESTIGTLPASCKPCSGSADCAATGTVCRHGFCEADDGRTSLSDCSALPAGATHTQIINNPCTAGARFESDPIP